MEKLGEYSPNALVYVLAHKMDLIKDNRNTVGMAFSASFFRLSNFIPKRPSLYPAEKSFVCLEHPSGMRRSTWYVSG